MIKTQTELYNLLSSTGLPIAYYSFNASNQEPQNPPYICYLTDEVKTISGDNKVRAKVTTYIVELYTDYKDTITETLLESAFDGADLFYTKNENYIESENLFQIRYGITI